MIACLVKGCPHRLRAPWWAPAGLWRCPAHRTAHHLDTAAAVHDRRRTKPPRLPARERILARLTRQETTA